MCQLSLTLKRKKSNRNLNKKVDALKTTKITRIMIVNPTATKSQRKRVRVLILKMNRRRISIQSRQKMQNLPRMPRNLEKRRRSKTGKPRQLRKRRKKRSRSSLLLK